MCENTKRSMLILTPSCFQRNLHLRLMPTGISCCLPMPLGIHCMWSQCQRASSIALCMCCQWASAVHAASGHPLLPASDCWLASVCRCHAMGSLPVEYYALPLPLVTLMTVNPLGLWNPFMTPKGTVSPYW